MTSRWWVFFLFFLRLFVHTRSCCCCFICYYFHNFLNQIFPTVFFSVASNVKWTAFRIMRDEEYHLVFFLFLNLSEILIKSIFKKYTPQNTNSHLNRLRTPEYMCYTHQTYIYFSQSMWSKNYNSNKKENNLLTCYKLVVSISSFFFYWYSSLLSICDCPPALEYYT